NGHLWHVIPGAHFMRPHSEDPNPHVYELIDQHADHYHWDTGKDWSDSRNVTGEHDRLGGGHAHSGVMIYLGDNWPQEYRGRLLTLNLHGRRVNVERLERDGTGYVGKHEPDMLHAADPWFRGIDLSYGPDGAVYILDWSDTGECHEHTGVHHTSGRIFRAAFNGESAERGARSAEQKTTSSEMIRSALRAPSSALIALHRHPNEWFVRQARRVLVERLGPQTRSNDEASRAAVCSELWEMFENEADEATKLRALWTLFQLGVVDDEFLLKQTRHPGEHVRAWVVRLLTDDCPLDTIQGQPHPFAKAPRDEVLRELIRLAKLGESGLVQLALASALQRLPVERRIELATPLASRVEDADDHNLPLMVWYGLLPVAMKQPVQLAKLANECHFPVTRRLIARRLAELIDEHPQAIEALLTSAKEDETLHDVLDGLTAGFAGRHKVKVPSGWKAVQQRVASSESEKLRERVRDLSVLFGDGRALDEVKRVALDGKAEMASRKAALQTLIDNRPDDLREVCEKLLAVRSLNTVAVRGLASFDDPALGEKLAKNYRSFYPQERPAVIETLVSRPSFAKALLAEMASGKIARADLSAFQARQIRSFGNAELTRQLTEVWGELRDSPDDKKQLAAKLKSRLTPDELRAADKSAGRAVFNKLCANCHRLYGHGSQIGPDLTGGGRHNLDYVVDNLVDPSAIIGADYRMSIVVLNDGRVLNGLVSGKTDRALTLQTAKDRLTLALSDIDEFQSSPLSLMPEGQLQPLTDSEIRNLVSYLMHPTQVPLP
ncbi:MAG: c-type cytochrome, partial [Candidatus Saccharimonas sp.]|nr:c-type cytochrome [Planctomycetaceae bacterium]